METMANFCPWQKMMIHYSVKQWFSTGIVIYIIYIYIYPEYRTNICPLMVGKTPRTGTSGTAVSAAGTAGTAGTVGTASAAAGTLGVLWAPVVGGKGCPFMDINRHLRSNGFCTYVCIYIYIHTYIHTFIHACMHACIHTYIHAYIHTYIHACLHTYIHTYIHTRTDIFGISRRESFACEVFLW